MTRRLSIAWPDRRPFRARDGRPIRILAASDEPDRSLDDVRNRDGLGPIDLVAGCGDLEPHSLAFLGDAFSAPIVYVRGNHDRGGPWPHPRDVPEASSGLDLRSLPGIPLLALPWPGRDRAPARHDELSAWWQALAHARLRLLGGPAPLIVLSHAPPEGANDTPRDPYHRGFAAYRFVLERLRPPLWLHGHASLAAATWCSEHGPTTLANVTGSVLVELFPPDTAKPESGDADSVASAGVPRGG